MRTLEEQHEREQYFFDQGTLRTLADVVERYERPCCLCAPMFELRVHRAAGE